MRFEEYIKENSIIQCERDPLKAKSLVKTSTKKVRNIKQLEITKENSSEIFNNIYTNLKETIEAIGLMIGYKITKPIAYVAFLKEINEESISEKVRRLNNIEEDINTNNKQLTTHVAKDLTSDIIKLRKKLIEKYLFNL